VYDFVLWFCFMILCMILFYDFVVWFCFMILCMTLFYDFVLWFCSATFARVFACCSCQILISLEFSRPIFRKILKYKILWKSVQWEPSCPVQTDGRTKVTKLTVFFTILAKAPKNVRIIQRAAECMPTLQQVVCLSWGVVSCINYLTVWSRNPLEILILIWLVNKSQTFSLSVSLSLFVKHLLIAILTKIQTWLHFQLKIITTHPALQ
jgi:hypothetical protein